MVFISLRVGHMVFIGLKVGHMIFISFKVGHMFEGGSQRCWVSITVSCWAEMISQTLGTS